MNSFKELNLSSKRNPPKFLDFQIPSSKKFYNIEPQISIHC